MNFGTQWITKGDWRQIDAFDVTISGFGGDKCGRVFTGEGGGLLDVQLNGSVKGAFINKDGFTTAVDVSAGAIFGGIGMGTVHTCITTQCLKKDMVQWFNWPMMPSARF